MNDLQLRWDIYTELEGGNTEALKLVATTKKNFEGVEV